MHAYLRSRDADAEGLPILRLKLRRTLAHYGVTDRADSPGLGPALYRIFLAHRRAAAYLPAVSALLQWRLRHPDSLQSESLAADVRDGYRRTVDQLVWATQLRHPAIGDLARQVRYRCFDAPLIAAGRQLSGSGTRRARPARSGSRGQGGWISTPSSPRASPSSASSPSNYPSCSR